MRAVVLSTVVVLAAVADVHVDVDDAAGVREPLRLKVVARH